MAQQRRQRRSGHRPLPEVAPVAVPRHVLTEPEPLPERASEDTPPATGQWRVSSLPPYLPAAAVLADRLWPELPQRPPERFQPSPPTLALLRQERLDAEQGAT